MNRRTTIVVNEQLLADAQAALGTRGLKSTVDRALQEAVRAAARERLAARLESGDGFDRALLSDDARSAQWRP